MCCIGLVYQPEATRVQVTNAALSLLWIDQLFTPVRSTVSQNNAVWVAPVKGQECLTHLTGARGGLSFPPIVLRRVVGGLAYEIVRGSG